jgi:hypothetical protein
VIESREKQSRAEQEAEQSITGGSRKEQSILRNAHGRAEQSRRAE